MRRPLDRSGFTLVELLVVITIMGMIALGVSAYLSSVLELHRRSGDTADLFSEGMLAMERMTQGARRSTYLMIPNAHAPVRTLLAFSGSVNDDNDNYFNDPLFPRIDEDLWRDINNDNLNGLAGIDDDGDGSTDETGIGLYDYDEDEDGQANEDDLDGIDNDGDGNIDEDMWADLNMDWASGVKYLDDDGDGSVDEGHENDDDEDGQEDEDPLNETVYAFDNATRTLTASYPQSGDATVLSSHVTHFEVTYEAPQRIRIEMTLTGDDGQRVEFNEHVYLQNTLQRIGRRVR
jgi:prepilin-type N-terminal cleavage/methylation domain-containing protein